MEVHFETDWCCFWILPLLQIVSVDCPHCGATDATAVSIGWFFWSLNFVFTGCEQ